MVYGPCSRQEYPRVPQALQYLGLPLFDEEILPLEAERRGARRLSEPGDVEFLAELLTQNRSAGGKPIIAVVRGRQEFGPMRTWAQVTSGSARLL